MNTADNGNPDYGTVLQNQGPDWRTMISDVLNDPEIARFHKKAPNTVFDVSLGRPSWFKPRTEPLNGSKSKKGPARISLGPSAFESREMLFTVLGHELIHASHYESGSFARWAEEFEFAQNGVLYAHYISESFAYKWSSPYVRKYSLENRVSGYDAYHYNLKRLPKNFHFIQ